MSVHSESGTAPLISIIVPVYEVEPYLRRCVDSILAQSYPNFEVLLVDDGSPDNCPKLCDEYAAGDARVRVIHKINGGLSDARNAGMAAAKGEYLGFVDGDDYIAPGMYEALCRALSKNGDKLAVCGFLKVTDEGTLKRKTKMAFPERMTEDEFWYELFFPYRDLGTVAWNKLYHRSLLEGLSFPKGMIHEDEWLVHRYISRAEHIAVANECLYYYVVREGSITSQALSPRSLSILPAFRRRLAYFSKTGKQRAVKLTMRNYARYVIFFLSDWKKDARYAAEKAAIKREFKGEIKKYKACAPFADYVYWHCAMYLPVLMRKAIRMMEERKRARNK